MEEIVNSEDRSDFVINEYHLENIFNMYTNNGYHFYNLGKKIEIPFNIPKNYYNVIIYNGELLTTLSNDYYNTPDLWWLILYTNNIYNPFKMPNNGSSLKILNKSVVRTIIDNVNEMIQQIQ